MNRGLGQELGPNYSPARREQGEKYPTHPLLLLEEEVSCWGLPLTKLSQKQRAGKPGSAACRGQLPRAQNGSGKQMENNQHAYTLSWGKKNGHCIPILQLGKLRPRGIGR